LIVDFLVTDTQQKHQTV